MTDVFMMTLKTLVRDRGLFVWGLAFPILLSTMFLFMFANLDDLQSFDAHRRGGRRGVGGLGSGCGSG